MMSWKNEVHKVVSKICPVGDIFTLDDIYAFSSHLEKIYPDNNHVEDKIRQTLQYLRDDGIIAFVGNNGEYLRIK